MTKNIPTAYNLPQRPTVSSSTSTSTSTMPSSNDQTSAPAPAPAPTSAPSSAQSTNATSAFDARKYGQPFCDFLSDNPTVFHAVSHFAHQLTSAGFTKLSEREKWDLKKGGKYFVERNLSSIIAFTIGKDYSPPNGVGIVAGHIDAVTVKLKPIPTLRNTEGYVQLGVAPYAGGLNPTWWDRDLGIAGKVIVKDSATGKATSRLVDLHMPIARVPTLAPHFGAAANGPFNPETQMVPIVGLDNSDLESDDATPPQKSTLTSKSEHTFTTHQPPRLVKAIASSLAIKDHSEILNWELEMYDTQRAQLGGLDREFIFGGRIDDKLCSWSAMQALLESDDAASPGIIKCVGCFDDEEIGSLLKQGARSNFLPVTIERIVESFATSSTVGNIAQTLANSFLLSSDVSHAVNPNFLNVYLANHAPRLNVGIVVDCDPNGHVTTDSVSTAILEAVAKKCGAVLQRFQIRNDSRSGGTIGPMTSSKLGVRAIDCGLPQLSMHSIRATTGSLDPGLGVQLFKGFFDYYEEIDEQFRDA